MIDIDKLEALAKLAGAGEWTASDSIVWFGDGDSAMHAMNPVPAFIAQDNLGAWPELVDAEDIAQFAAAVCPANVLALIAEVRALRDRDIKLFYELEGVVIDTERGHGFDEVCLDTIKRVRDALGGAK